MRALAGQRAFLGTAALVFATSAAVTWIWCAPMASMPCAFMPWMRMPGQGWSGVAANFAGMWIVMMIAMMLPALVPMLLRYRRAIYSADVDTLTLRVAGGYFAVWALAGLLAFLPGVALATVAMQVPAVERALPLAAALATLLAGLWQLSAWKTRQLACCRETVDCCRPPRATAAAAWRHGTDLGLRCLRCCAPLTALLFVMGVMDPGAMALVTLAISLERLAPRGERIARVIGVMMVGAGLLGVVRAFE